MFKKNYLMAAFTVAFSAAVTLGALSTSTAYASSCGQSVVSGEASASEMALEKVGETRLRVMLFRIYDAELYSDNGNYSGANELLLRLQYARDFSAAKLAEQTQDEWERMGYPQNEQSDAWISELSAMWPDVNSGDCIVAHRVADGGIKFYGTEGELGIIENSNFADQFLSIWLSEDARFRSSRDELVGVK